MKGKETAVIATVWSLVQLTMYMTTGLWDRDWSHWGYVCLMPSWNSSRSGRFSGGTSNNGHLNMISRLVPFSSKSNSMKSFYFLILNISTKFSLLTSGSFWKTGNQKQICLLSWQFLLLSKLSKFLDMWKMVLVFNHHIERICGFQHQNKIFNGL